MKRIQVLIGLCAAVSIGLAFALSPASTSDPKTPCEKEICFLTADGKVKYEKQFNCKFKDCHLANGEDIFRWAIGKKETGGAPYYYDTPDENPCNAGNDYCAATTGNPASAGRDKFYAASYGSHQITLPLLFDWLNPNGKTKFSPVPDCLQKWFLDDKTLMDAMKEANKRLAFGKGLVSGRKVPAATVDKDGKITYPAILKAIQDQAEALNIGKGESAAEWTEMWERMAAWERLRQIIEAKWKAMGGDKKKAWEDLASLSDTPKKKGERKPETESERAYLTLLGRLKMNNNGDYKIGIKPYITSTIWNEAAAGFGNFALFAGAPPNLYTRLMAFFANKDCHIATVKQMYQLPKHGYDDGKHADPKEAETEKWVKKAAGAWNGAGSKSAYAKLAFEYYESYYDKHYGKTEVCN